MTTNSNRVHWLGAGLSSIPGIKQLDAGKAPLIVWNRSLEKAQKLLADTSDNTSVRQLNWDDLTASVSAGDVVVSMLPATMHVEVAQLCLNANAHFVSSSYVSEQMQALDDKAKAQNLAFVNEVGLDPGIDHLLAHALIAKYEQSSQFKPQNQHSFRSYCGGFPAIANDFKYKFSWSPLGVLKALKSPAKWVANNQEQTCQAPWESISDYQAQFNRDGEVVSETFQAYPNRDSVPFIKQYQFGDDWQVAEFVRGTLRLDGWSQAWQPIFDEVASLSFPQGDERLAQLSQELETKYSYEANEPDRVVLCVELEVKDQDNTVWHQSYQLDSYGNENGQAMGRLVSLTVSIAVEAVLAGQLDSGVSAAPHDLALVDDWLKQLENLGETISLTDHLA